MGHMDPSIWSFHCQRESPISTCFFLRPIVFQTWKSVISDCSSVHSSLLPAYFLLWTIFWALSFGHLCVSSLERICFLHLGWNPVFSSCPTFPQLYPYHSHSVLPCKSLCHMNFILEWHQLAFSHLRALSVPSGHRCSACFCQANSCLYILPTWRLFGETFLHFPYTPFLGTS